MKKTLFFLALSLSLKFFAQMNCYYQQHVAYTMDIHLNVDTYQYTGKQSLVYTNNSPDVLNKVYYHLYWNAFQPNSMMDQRIQYMGKEADGRMVKKVEDKTVSRISDLPKNLQGFQNIHWLMQDGKKLKYHVEGTILVVELDHPIAANGGTSTFTMEWDAQVPEQIRRSGRDNKEGIKFSMTQWYPKMAEYDYEGWHTWEYVQREFQGVFGDFLVNITLDNNYVIAAGGVLKNPEEVKGYSNYKPKGKGETTWKFEAHNIHDFAWAADPDYIVDKAQVPNGPLLYFVRQAGDETSHWPTAIPLTVQFFQLMNANFGTYQYPTYTFAQGGDGGMEYGMITLIMGNKRGKNPQADLQGLCGLMFHEASHSWFQQIIGTNESMRAWMDEGFTSFAENFVMDKLFPTGEYYNQEATETLVSIQKAGREESMGNLADQYETSVGYSVASYVKGSAVLSTLSYIMGEDLLWQTLRTYFDTWKLKHPTDRDFMHIAQKVSGMDLKWFFNYFVYTTQAINYSIENVSAQSKQTLVELRNNGVFPMPIDLLITMKDGKQTTYSIPLQMMRGEKTKDLFPLVILPDWQWTSKNYTAQLPIELNKIQSIQIDGTGRLPNISDNIKVEF